MVALYSFEGQEPSDLSFEKNEILDIIEKPQEEWWEARNALGNVGLVPGNYLVYFSNFYQQVFSVCDNYRCRKHDFCNVFYAETKEIICIFIQLCVLGTFR